jgi:hypothetical protein
MSALSSEQLVGLRNQIEEDYRMDLAALERLLRRFGGTPVTAPTPGYTPAPIGSEVDPYSVGSEPPVPLMPASGAPVRQSDELVDSLRAMFASSHSDDSVRRKSG